MDEDVTDQTASAPQSGPAAAAGGSTVIEAFPGELGAVGAIARAVAHVEIGSDGEKRKFTAVLATEGKPAAVPATAEQVHDVMAVLFGIVAAKSEIAAGTSRRRGKALRDCLSHRPEHRLHDALHGLGSAAGNRSPRCRPAGQC